MRVLITALLSALLIWFAPHINKSAAATPQQPGKPQQAEIAPTVVSQLQQVTAKPVRELAVISPHEALMLKAGIPQSEWNATSYIVSHESSWNPSARNAETGAYGLCQAYPASKMASAGRDYRTNPVTQLKWCHSYAQNRYNGWWGAFAFWRGNKWW
jgi:hypothetical protein